AGGHRHDGRAGRRHALRRARLRRHGPTRRDVAKGRRFRAPASGVSYGAPRSLWPCERDGRDLAQGIARPYHRTHRKTAHPNIDRCAVRCPGGDPDGTAVRGRGHRAGVRARGARRRAAHCRTRHRQPDGHHNVDPGGLAGFRHALRRARAGTELIMLSLPPDSGDGGGAVMANGIAGTTTTRDAIGVEVFANLFKAVVDEMAWVVLRSSHTTFVKETQDFGVALVTPEGEMFAYPYGSGATVLMGVAMDSVTQGIAWEEGDVVITNDPYATRGMVMHLNDIYAFRPVFADGELLCLA